MRQWTVSFCLAMIVAGAAAHAATIDVYVYNNEFSVNPPGSPVQDAVITVGDTVRWVHLQGNHTTTSVAGIPEQWNATINSQYPEFSYTFSNEGTFAYYCIPHGSDNGDGTASGMAGTVTVLPDETGACCVNGGGCSITTPADCLMNSGLYLGSDATCDPNPCDEELIGACCFSDGNCQELTDSQCALDGGTYQGHATTCNEVSCPIDLQPFIDPLPVPPVAQPISGEPGGEAHYEIAITEQFQQLHSELPPTRVWGYNGLYPGPTIEAWRDETVTVTWINDLRVAETGELRQQHALTVDECLHGPNISGQTPLVVTHLHGGKVPPGSDGYPEDAFAPGEQSPVYTYPNIQPAATLWYHDHALGITRLNVMMGLAGFYLIRDDEEAALNLPGGEHEMPLVIQDRSFNSDGSLNYPEMWHEHFFGDVTLVNGKVWPYLEVERGKYRFRVLNGSNSRAYTLSLSSGATFWQIGSDLGLLEAPVPLTDVTLLPGERADLIVDFFAYPVGEEIVLTNSAPAPYPGVPGVGVIPEVMKFIVTDEVGDTDALPASLVDVPRIDEGEAVVEREFDLELMPNVHCPEHDSGMWTIDGMMWDDITEFPELGSTEIWTWRNDSGISHPMHVHMVLSQVLDRQAIDPETGEPTGPKIPPAPNEMGWKDTIDAPPGHVTRVIARFDGFTGLFAYHCHILEHEDHEMMRQFQVVEPSVPGDLNGDSIVNGADLLILLSAWGVCADPNDCPGDLNEDGFVNGADLLVLLSNWG